MIPSGQLVPENDPTTLFTGSGMQPMITYLLGQPHPKGKRIADSQKCFRSQDIEEVGDNRHTTFFEMLGNWSLGDFFKEMQIPMMWEYLVEDLQLDHTRLYFTCFKGSPALNIPRDTESAETWQKLFKAKGMEVGIGENPEVDGMRAGEHIFYYPEKKNWWSRAGVPTNMPLGEPGGPDTEMFFDFDPKNTMQLHEKSQWKDEPCHVNCDCGRFIEIGNNVFMQYINTSNGFEELPQRNVDFGAGLERITAALIDTPDVFMIDVFDEPRKTIQRISGKKYEVEYQYAYRVILDHLRAATFLIGDNVFPGNKDQQYFVRRLIRRAVRFARNLDMHENFCKEIAHSFITVYGEHYSNLIEKHDEICDEIDKEETKFRATLEHGLKEFAKIHTAHIDGVTAFNLLQNYGFPVELTQELAKEKGMTIDMEAFEKAREEHAASSRTASAGKFKGGLADTSRETTALHSACHIMLAAMRKVVGDHVHQAGSNITAERLRFDFTHKDKITDEQVKEIEMYVNAAIQHGFATTITKMPKTQAQAEGVEGSFWEKYPDEVTVYTMQGSDGTVYSRELCGGPHVATSADMQHADGTLKKFAIAKQEAVSAGVRRIKAVLS